LVNLSLCMIRPQLRSTLFPYTTLFRSLCERGIRTFEPYTRNTLDLAAIPSLQTLSHLPVISDPSHDTGRRELVEPMAKASVAAGANGLIVEMHTDPDNSSTGDGVQSLFPDQFAALLKDLEKLCSLVGRRVDTPKEPEEASTTWAR